MDEANVKSDIAENTSKEEEVAKSSSEATSATPAIVNDEAKAIMKPATEDWEKLSLESIHRKVFNAAVKLRQLIIDQIDAGDIAKAEDTALQLQTLICNESRVKQSRFQLESLASCLKDEKDKETFLARQAKKLALSVGARDLQEALYMLGRQHERVLTYQEAYDTWNAQKALRNGEI